MRVPEKILLGEHQDWDYPDRQFFMFLATPIYFRSRLGQRRVNYVVCEVSDGRGRSQARRGGIHYLPTLWRGRCEASEAHGRADGEVELHRRDRPNDIEATKQVRESVSVLINTEV
jgi:hypothetical protein